MFILCIQVFNNLIRKIKIISLLKHQIAMINSLVIPLYLIRPWLPWLKQHLAVGAEASINNQVQPNRTMVTCIGYLFQSREMFFSNMSILLSAGTNETEVRIFKKICQSSR